MIYFVLLAWLLLCAYTVLYKKIDVLKLGCAKKTFLILVFFACALVMGLRDSSVGVDTVAYMNHFDRFAQMSFGQIIGNYNLAAQEIGYSLLMKLTSCVINSYYFFQLVVAALYCFGMAKFIYDNAEDVLMATVCFLGIGLYFQAFNTAQQFFAVMFALNSWTFLRRKEYLKAAVLLAVGCTMHMSCFMFLPAYVLYFLRKQKLLLNLMPVLILLVALNYRWILEMAVVVFPMYKRYLSSQIEANKVGLVFVVWMIVAALSLFTVYGSFLTRSPLYRKVFGEDSVPERDFSALQKTEAILCLVYVTTCLIGMQFTYFERIGLYFMPFTMTLFPMVRTALPNKLIRNIYTVGVCVCFLAFYILTGLRAEQYQYTFFFMA